MENLSFKGIVIRDKTVSLETINIQSLQPNYVVIQVKASAVGPFDLYFIDGSRPLEQDRINVGGYEGSGIIVKVGSDVDQSFLGKRVAFESDYSDKHSTGGWAEIAIVNVKHVFPIDDKLNFESASQFLGNPLTCYSLFNNVVKDKHKTIMLDAASSAIGRMIIRMCLKAGIEVIGIVRKDENLKILDEEGCRNSFSQNSSTFYKDIKVKIEELKPTLYLTCMGGGMQSTLFTYLPDFAILCSIGNLNNEKLFGFSTADFIFKRKQIVGWHIFPYIKSLSPEEVINHKQTVQNIMINEKIFTTNFIKTVRLEDFETELKEYRKNMSSGKLLIKPY